MAWVVGFLSPVLASRVDMLPSALVGPFRVTVHAGVHPARVLQSHVRFSRREARASRRDQASDGSHPDWAMGSCSERAQGSHGLVVSLAAYFESFMQHADFPWLGD